jgi:hypothetical protein
MNRERKDARQLIVSTHSDDLLSDPGIAAEEIVRLEPSKNGTQIVFADESDKSALRAGLTAADVFLPKAAPLNIEQLMLAFD